MATGFAHTKQDHSARVIKHLLTLRSALSECGAIVMAPMRQSGVRHMPIRDDMNGIFAVILVVNGLLATAIFAAVVFGA